MRKNRKAEEDFFVQKFMGYFRATIDNSASEIRGITDKPDLAISSFGRVIGVEFSQIPSKYIIENLHKKMPAPKDTKNVIEGHLSVYPFEPHRWVHDVLNKKRGKVAAHKKRINAHEMWLVLHCHSTKREWPMSDGSKGSSREAEALLMRFGTKQHRRSFGRIFYIYADGSVVDLTCGSEIVPSTVTLPDRVGYPAVTTHQFSFSFDVPLPGLGILEHHFDNIQFAETIVAPLDSWMAEREPEIERPKFAISARVDSEKMEWKILRNSALIADQILATSDHIGKTMNTHFLLEWSIQKTTLTPHT